VEAGAEPASDRNELHLSDAAGEDTTPAREERSDTTASVV
jgi:hypothetical protein